MKAKEGKITDLKQDDRNANSHKERGKELLQKSLHELGAGRSVLADANNVLIAGNNTVETAISEGITKTLVVETTGDTLVVVKRTDLDLNDPGEAGRKARAMALIDNSSALAGIEWDVEAVQEIEEQWGFEAVEWGVEFPEEETDETTGDDSSGSDDGAYSKKIQSPTYEPKNEAPPVSELFDTTVTERLLSEIESSDLPEKDKMFLKLAAARHTVFNYEKIADYYANATPEIQRLMENSALIIIDFEKAIELGYVRLGEEIAKLYGEEYGNEE